MIRVVALSVSCTPWVSKLLHVDVHIGTVYLSGALFQSCLRDIQQLILPESYRVTGSQLFLKMWVPG